MTLTQKIVGINKVNLLVNEKEEMPRIVVIIPAYNEENAIARVVNMVSCVLQDVTDIYDILVVDDDSGDTTRQILDRLDIQRFYNRKNLGKGDVIRNVLVRSLANQTRDAHSLVLTCARHVKNPLDDVSIPFTFFLLVRWCYRFAG